MRAVHAWWKIKMSGTPRRREKGEGSTLTVRRDKKQEEKESDDAPDNGNSRTRPDKPCHRQRESLFSSGSGYHNYRGLLNDCILLLVLSNSKNVITNLLKYGILVNPIQWGEYSINSETIPTWVCLLGTWLFPLIALKVEQLAAKERISNRTLLTCHITALTAVLILPCVALYILELGPISSFFSLAWTTVLWMKLVSYMEVNWWCRNSPSKMINNDPDQKQKQLVKYPDNLTVGDVVYFFLAPTLCYELNFPRNKGIRKVFLFRRLLEAVFIFNVVLAIFQQWLVPTALNSLQPFKDMDYVHIFERVLLLAIPNHLFWLLCFYFYFHSVLNILGELLRFADRQFYEDWWNSQTLRYFWRTWNIPVHLWFSRHVYGPLVKGWKFNKLAAQGVVFVVSAFFHEYLVSIPLRMLRPYALVSMIAQVPLVALTSLSFMQGQIGNVLVWSSIVLGQPVAILMYMHDYYWLHWHEGHNATLTV